MDLAPDIKKKRGRKKKVDTLEQQDLKVVDQVGTEKPKSRRGRKAKVVVSNLEIDPSVGSLSDDENVIVKLKVQADGFVDEQPSLDKPPDAYNEGIEGPFSSVPYTFDNEHVNINEIAKPSSRNFDLVDDERNLKVMHLLKDFEMKSKANEWPSNTSIACYWCCHQFNTVPFGIPVKYLNGCFHVFGCFCSLECASAYNFNSSDGIDEVFERHNLISLLSRKLGSRENVKPAPSRLSLNMFGGHLNIDEFRGFTSSRKVLNVNFPPMMTLTQQIEEINECDINSEYRYIPIDHERINKYKEKITLKRTKPVTNFKNTLDHTMNLKIQPDAM